MIYRAMTIAGSDSSGGAGIQTDLKTFAALGVYGMSAITSITAQNTMGVTMIEDISPACVSAQIEACLDDIGQDAIKVGMLSNVAIIEAVDQSFCRYRPKHIVIDPVMVATTGARLLKADAQVALTKLLRHASVVTPNRAEAEVLAEMTIDDRPSAECAAKAIAKFTNGAILIKGIAPGDDLLYCEGQSDVLSAEWIDTTNSHGTGCTLSSAIAAYLARGESLGDAVMRAKDFVHHAISAGLPIGKGHGPTQPMFAAWPLLKQTKWL